MGKTFKDSGKNGGNFRYSRSNNNAKKGSSKKSLVPKNKGKRKFKVYEDDNFDD